MKMSRLIISMLALGFLATFVNAQASEELVEEFEKSTSQTYSFCAEITAGLTVQVADLTLHFGGAASVTFTEGPDGSNAVSLTGMIGAGLSAGAVIIKGSYNIQGELSVNAILPESIKSTEYVKAIKWVLLRWFERQREQSPAGRVVEYLGNTKSQNKIQGVMRRVRERMEHEQHKDLHERFMHTEMVDDADKKFKEFIIAYRHRASNILEKIKQIPKAEHYSLVKKQGYTKVFQVYVEEVWAIWSQIYMTSDVDPLTKKATIFGKKKIKCSNGMFGKKPSGIQQLFCTWMKYGFMIPGKDRDKKGDETENIMHSFGLVYPELFPGYKCTDVSEEGGGCNGKVDVDKLIKLLEEVDLPELFFQDTKSHEFSFHDAVKEITSSELNSNVHKDIVKHVTKKRERMKFFHSDDISTDAKEKLDQLLVLFGEVAHDTLGKIDSGTEPEAALQIYQQEFSALFGEIYLNDIKALKGESKTIECSKVPNMTPFQQLFCTFLKNGYFIPGKLGRGDNDKQNVIQSLGYVYPELFPGYSCETKYFQTARDLGRQTSTKCQIDVEELRELLHSVATQDERDEWADVGDEDAQDFTATGITHDLLPVDPDEFEEMWEQLFNQSQYSDGECLQDETCGISSITFTGKRTLQLGASGGICSDVGTGIEVTRARPRKCNLLPNGDGLNCVSAEKINTAVAVRAAGNMFFTSLGWTGSLFDGAQENGLSLTIGVRAPAIEVVNIFGTLTDKTACDVLYNVGDVVSLIKMVVQEERRDEKNEEGKFISKIKTGREKMKRIQKSLAKIFERTKGVVGDIAKAVTKKVLVTFFTKMLGNVVKNVSPVAAHFTSVWAFGFDLSINFAKKDAGFSFIFAKKKDFGTSGTVGAVKVGASLGLEKNTVCNVQLGSFVKGIFAQKAKEEL